MEEQKTLKIVKLQVQVQVRSGSGPGQLFDPPSPPLPKKSSKYLIV